MLRSVCHFPKPFSFCLISRAPWSYSITFAVWIDIYNALYVLHRSRLHVLHSVSFCCALFSYFWSARESCFVLAVYSFLVLVLRPIRYRFRKFSRVILVVIPVPLYHVVFLKRARRNVQWGFCNRHSNNWSEGTFSRLLYIFSYLMLHSF